MDFFNSLIDDVNSLISELPKKCFTYDKNTASSDTGYSQVILQRDTAYELSGTGFTLVTSQPVEDSIVVVGDDLSEIKENRKFARISMVQIDDVADEQKAYNLIRKIEYVKYHYFPEGYMIRTASSSYKEVVRVAKSAIRRSISFENVGDLLIDKYKKIPTVKGVRVIFVTVPDADYDSFFRIAEKNNDIAKALNHVMNTVNFDCDTCNLKPVCDEVEGMRELHFRKGANSLGN